MMFKKKPQQQKTCFSMDIWSIVIEFLDRRGSIKILLLCRDVYSANISAATYRNFREVYPFAASSIALDNPDLRILIARIKSYLYKDKHYWCFTTDKRGNIRHTRDVWGPDNNYLTNIRCQNGHILVATVDFGIASDYVIVGVYRIKNDQTSELYDANIARSITVDVSMAAHAICGPLGHVYRSGQIELLARNLIIKNCIITIDRRNPKFDITTIETVPHNNKTVCNIPKIDENFDLIVAASSFGGRRIGIKKVDYSKFEI